nr:T9SS type A sorting domain-containing protein [candidate division Zixibacteria bacterium]
MRCRKIREKLTEVARAGVVFNPDTELLVHLQNCPECARQAYAAGLLKRDLELAGIDDDVETVSLETLRSRVESLAIVTEQNIKKELSIMSILVNQVKRRPRFSIGLAGILVAVLLSLLIPIRYDRTVGYEVAFAGVDKNLAMDTARINGLLEKLGVAEAAVDISDCEETCKLVISNLKSSDDARLVVAAFSDIDKVNLTKDITPVKVDVSGNILSLAADKITLIFMDEKDSLGLHEIVINKLGDEEALRNIIWIVDDSIPEGEASFNIAIANCDSVGGITTIYSKNGLQGTTSKGLSVVAVESEDTFITDGNDRKYDHLMIASFDSAGSKNLVWVANDTSGQIPCIVRLDSIPDEYLYLGMKDVDSATDEWLRSKGIIMEAANKESGKCLILKPGESDDGDYQYIQVPQSTGVVFLIDGEELDDAVRKKLEEKGLLMKYDDRQGINLSPDRPMEIKKDPMQSDKDGNVLLEGYRLSQNFPNPFNPITRIEYSIPSSEHVRIDIVNINGQKIRTLVNQTMGPGDYSVEWDATDDDGVEVATGVYFYRFNAGKASRTMKMTYMK